MSNQQLGVEAAEQPTDELHQWSYVSGKAPQHSLPGVLVISLRHLGHSTQQIDHPIGDARLGIR